MAMRVGRNLEGRVQAPPRATGPRIRNGRIRRLPPLSRRYGRAVDRSGRLVLSIWDWFYRGYRTANAGDLAAAVAFNALVALVPIALLLLSVAGFLLQHDEVFLKALVTTFWVLTPGAAHDALNALTTVKHNGGWFGAASFVGFAWVGTNFVSCLARSMNRIYDVPNRRFVHQRPRDFAVVLVFAVLALLAAGAAILPSLFVGQDLDFFFRAWALASARVQILSYALSIAAATALFFVLYRVVPNAGQKLRDVWPGSLTAALLFVLLVQAFPIYVRVIGGVNRYGQAFALVSLLVAWFYLLAHVLLFGSYVNATYQRHCERRRIVAGHVLPGCE